MEIAFTHQKGRRVYISTYILEITLYTKNQNPFLNSEKIKQFVDETPPGLNFNAAAKMLNKKFLFLFSKSSTIFSFGTPLRPPLNLALALSAWLKKFILSLASSILPKRQVQRFVQCDERHALEIRKFPLSKGTLGFELFGE